MRLERLEDRTLLTLAPAASIGELAPAALGPGYLYSRPLDLGQYLAALPTTANGPLPDVASASASLNVPKLRSNAGATARLFLDFDGHDEANWGDRKNVHTPAFTMDSNGKSFSNSELAAINEIWARVAEDFAPFNIDVTTVDPGTYPRGRVAVIAIGGDYSDWYGDASGGVAHVAGFTDNYAASNVGYVFSRTLDYRANWIADAASHEAGHLFGLNHQAVWNGDILVDDYLPGMALMGVSYDAPRSTWYNGAPETSSRVIQDEMAIIAGPDNGFGYRADDYGDTLETAAALSFTGTSATISGLIGQTNDHDVWKFATTGGQVVFELIGATYGANLDAVLELWDGNSVVTCDESSTSLTAKISANIPAGTYYLMAHGKGDYGDVGRYTITGTFSATAPEIDISVDGVAFHNQNFLDFGTTMKGQPVTRIVTVTNTGTAPLTLLPLSWWQSQRFDSVTLVSDLGKDLLQSGESTSFTLRFDAATELDLRGLYFELLNNDFDEGIYRFNLLGHVNLPLHPLINVSMDGVNLVSGESFYFGSTTPDGTLTRTFTVTNGGPYGIQVYKIYGETQDGFTLVSNLSRDFLNPGDSTEFVLRLDPRFTHSIFTRIIWSGTGTVPAFRLTLEGTVRAAVDFTMLDSSEPGAFTTTVGSPLIRTFDVVNVSEKEVSFSPLTAGQIPSGYSLVSNLTATTLAPGQHAYFVLRLDANEAGDFRHSIQIPLNNVAGNPVELNLEGIVKAPSAPEIALTFDGQNINDGGMLNVGEIVQGGSITTTFTVTNLGSVWLHLAPFNSGQMPSGFSIASNVDRTAIGPGESTTLTVRISAGAVDSLSGVVQLLSNDSDEGTYDVTVTGTATAPQRQILDDGDAGNAFVGNWKQPKGKGYGRDIHYASKGKGYRYSVWGFNNLSFGQYRVYATWPGGNKNASNAPFSMFDGMGLQSRVRANQRVAPGPQTASGRWKSLGIVNIHSGQLVVTLTNAANGIVVADAVYIEQVSGLASQPQIVNAGSASTTRNSKTNALALGQLSANAADLVPANAEFLSPPTTTPNSPGQSTTVAIPPTTASAIAAGPAELADVQSVDGIRTRLAKREPDTLSNIVDQLAWEQSTDDHEAAGNSLEIRDKLLASLLTHELPPFVC